MPPFNCSSAAAANTTAPAAEARWLYAALAVIPLWIVFGNLLVMLAVLLQRNLHTLSSRVIASLAVTDFLLALCVVPLGIYQLVAGRWELGLYACVAWTGSDVFLSTTSILHLCVIAIYRCMGISHPLRMRRQQGGRHAAALLLPAWGVSLVISLPLVVQGVTQRDNVLRADARSGALHCGIYQRTFVVYSSMVSFFVPLAVMLVADVRSVFVLRRDFVRGVSPPAGRDAPSSVSPSPASSVTLRCSPLPAPGPTPGDDGSPCSPLSVRSLRRFLPPAAGKLAGSLRSALGRAPPPAPPPTPPPATPPAPLSYLNMLANGGASRSANSRERRAEKTLMWVFVCFVGFWLPFFCTNLAYGLCATCDVPDPLFAAFTWLGYISSGVNPCIYTLLNRDFRAAFRNILLCRRQRPASWSPRASQVRR